MQNSVPAGRVEAYAVKSHHSPEARLAQPVERKALNLVVVGSSPTVGVTAKLCVCLPLLARVVSG